MGNDFFKKIVTTMKDKDTTLVSDIKEVHSFVDTGSYTLNAILSTDLLVEYLVVRLLHSPVLNQLVKRSLFLESSEHFLKPIRMLVLSTTTQKVVLPKTLLKIEE